MQFCLGPLCLGTIQTLNVAQKVRLKLSKTHENMRMYQDQKLCEIFLTTRVACSRDYIVMECSAEGNLPSTQTYNWQYFHCHFHRNWPDNRYLQQYILRPLNFQHHWKVYHYTFTFFMLCKKYIIPLSFLLSPWLHSSSFETCLRPKMGLVPRENCPMKTNPGSKTQSGLNNGIFFHSKLPFTTSFPLFLRQKREGWPISQLSHKDKRSEAHNFSSLDTVKGYNPKLWNIFVQFPEVGMILTHFPLYQASIFSIESHPIQFSGSLLIPISSILESCNPTNLNPSSLNNSKVC